MVIEGRLTSADLKRMANELRNYETSLNAKIHRVLERLADLGVYAGQTTIGNFGSFVTFSKHTDGLGVVVVAQEMSVIHASWLRYGQRIDADVSPLLMAEFGVGSHAVIWEGQNSNTDTLSDGKKIGRGTFPNQTHANESTWWYMDLNKQWHQASGVKPTRPMHNAMLEIIAQVNATAREVFGNGSN